MNKRFPGRGACAFLLTSILLLCGGMFARAEDAGGVAAPNALRPATISWGAFAHNEQLIGADAQWPFVAKYMDAFLLHGMYWIKKNDQVGKVPEDRWLEAVKAVGGVLKKNGKTAQVETGFAENQNDYDYNVAEKRNGYVRAHADLDMYKLFETHGIQVTKTRVDWFPISSAATYAEKFQTTNLRELLLMVTGDEKTWGKMPGFDPARGNWREYVTEIAKVYPKMEFAIDQAPCNFFKITKQDPEIRKLAPWEPLGYGYFKEELATIDTRQPARVNGKPVRFEMDFADLMMSVARVTRDLGLNYYGFEGDTPYEYVTENKGRPGTDLLPFLLRIERMQHKYGLRNGKLINDCPKTSDDNSVLIDLGAVCNINRVVIRWGDDFAKRFIIKAGKDAASIVKPVFTDANGKGGVSDIKVSSKTAARYLKIDLRVRESARGYQIAEVEVYGPEKPSVNLALGKKALVETAKPKAASAKKAAAKRGNIPAPEIVDGDAKTFWESDYEPNDAWDKRFHDRTLEYLEVYQGAGGRADQYIVESWYHGPFALVPETKPGSFTNLVKDFIRRVRGIDDNGEPFKADLMLRRKGAEKFAGEKVYQRKAEGAQALSDKGAVTYEVALRNDGVEINKGDCRATPLLRAREKSSAGWTIKYADAQGKDITEQALALGTHDGFFAGGMEPGESKSVFVTVTPPASGQGECTVDFELYWNPQDPQGLVRDAVALRVAGR